MADSQPVPSQAHVGRSSTNDCPRVADLIDFALGHAGSDDRQRIEVHLVEQECMLCRSWLDKANVLRAEPWPDTSSKFLNPAIALGSTSPQPAPSTDQTPFPPSSKWQRLAFHDLEARLRLLDEC